jgi:hypothetical protein
MMVVQLQQTQWASQKQPQKPLQKQLKVKVTQLLSNSCQYTKLKNLLHLYEGGFLFAKIFTC